ncbi:MAG: TIGR04211 family SH3 domain-containing protein [Deltaproteobacteria bacterium]|nr:TIGR04211 family SH3 domain-containing protein [Deltaproteobacteria bacterium]
MKDITKFTVFIGFILIVFYNTALAETMYVSDVLKLIVREGKGTGEKIITVLQSGQTVEVLQPEDDWALVRFNDGQEGWVLNRYLTGKVTNNIKLKLLKKKHKALVAQSAALLEERAKLKEEKIKLKEENKEFKAELDQIQKEAEDLKMSYGTLKTESADFINLKSKYTKTASKLDEYTKKSELLEKELTKLEFKQTVRWLLTGAGVLLLGFIIGFGTKRQRRRTTLR